MRAQIVLHHASGRRHEFDPADAGATAEARLRELTGRGFRAVAPDPNGDAGKIAREFGPQTEQVLSIPQPQLG